MSNIAKAAQVIAEHSWSEVVGGCTGLCNWNGENAEDEREKHAAHVAQALADAGQQAPENTRTEWGVRFSEQYIDVAPSEQAAREKASYIGRPVTRRTVTSAVTGWEVAP